MAVQQGHAECVELLLDAGAECKNTNQLDALFPHLIPNHQVFEVALGCGCEANMAYDPRAFVSYGASMTCNSTNSTDVVVCCVMQALCNTVRIWANSKCGIYLSMYPYKVLKSM